MEDRYLKLTILVLAVCTLLLSVLLVAAGAALIQVATAQEVERTIPGQSWTAEHGEETGSDARPGLLVMEATAYSHECGNGDGFTATMTRPRPGVVAVDPAVIPLGTQLYVEGYGPARAEDTGGLIKGERIDVFFDCRSRALQWGRRMVIVEVLN